MSRATATVLRAVLCAALSALLPAVSAATAQDPVSEPRDRTRETRDTVPAPGGAGRDTADASSSAPSLAELGRVPTGEPLDRVTSDFDPTRSYALYLPTAYDPRRAWPVLLVMDPRGRARLALDLFRPAAEELGYIVLSSHDTRSDDPDAPNEQAAEAMLADVQRFLNVDGRRFYLAGFSGTARVAWRFAVRLRGSVAGVIGVGAGLPVDYAAALEPLKEYLTFAFFGGAGTTDFNFEEVRRLDQRLDGMGVAHRIARWEGRHGWPPTEVCGQALEWMELQAVRAGLRERDRAWIRRLAEARREEAAALADAGRAAEAAAAYRAIAEDFGGLLPVEEDRTRAEALAAFPAARRAAELERELADRHRRLTARLGSMLEEIRRRGPSAAGRAARELEVAALRAEATAGPDTAARPDPDTASGADATPTLEAGLRRDAARRLLETYFVHASYYEPRRYLEEGDPARALAVLSLADAVDPASPRVCLQRARAQALAGRPDDALRELECLVATGRADADALESDPHLSALRTDRDFEALLRRIRGDG